jgi:methylase of polypeptide subunit release factors
MRGGQAARVYDPCVGEAIAGGIESSGVSASRTGAGPGPPEAGDRGAVAELGAALRAAGLTGEGVRRALGVQGELLARASDIPVHVRRLADAGPLGALVRLFVLELPVTAADAADAFGPLPLERVLRLGVAEQEGDEVRSLARIVPHDEILIASDRRLPGGEDAPDYVAGVHAPSLTLSHLTVRRPVETALDVGTGSGVQAILASRHSGRVVASDVNERSLRFAAFNAALNRVDNVEWRAGSFFEPAAGERFGLVTSNPPYVISPESAFLFRDGGLEGDGVSRLVVGGAPAHLEEGGFATVLVSWTHVPGEDWSGPLREWVAGSGCDAWLLHHGTEDPLTHTARWNHDHLGRDPEAFGEVLDRWLAYFERLGIEGIAYGAVILRRRGGASNWVRADELAGDRLRPASAHVQRVFEAADYLHGLTDDTALLDDAFAIAPAARLEQRLVLERGEWTLAEVTLALDEGLCFDATLGGGAGALLASLDGRRPLRAVVDELAAERGLDRESATRDAIGAVSGMLGAGFLVRGDH